jgi:hypothetical protein
MDNFYWNNRLTYWGSYFQLLRELVLRKFFDPDYNNDIEGIESFAEEKVGLAKIEGFLRWFENHCASEMDETTELIAITPD